jgi:chaperone BCS1
MRHLCLTRSCTKDPDDSGRWNTLLCMEPGGFAVNVFDDIEFT